jgi:hypothetical protein
MSERGPDLPAVPRARRSIMVLIYAVLGAGVLAGWVASNAFGWPIASTQTERGAIPSDVRSKGGYRVFGFWHSGYQGGK